MPSSIYKGCDINDYYGRYEQYQEELKTETDERIRSLIIETCNLLMLLMKISIN